MKKLLKALAFAVWAGVLSTVCGAAQVAAPGNFSDCEVLSYVERQSNVAATKSASASPTGTVRGTLKSVAPNTATIERSWVVRSSSNSNVTYAVKQTLNAASGGEISMCAYSPNRVLATLLKGKSYADFVAGMTAKGFKVVRELMKDLEGNSVYVIESTDTEHDVVELMQASIQASGFCDDIKPDHIFSANVVPNDGKWADQWNMVKIGAPKAWNTRTDASSVLVAVLDTGVNFDHIDLNQNLWMNPIETADMGNGEDDDGNGIVDDVYGISSDGGNVSGNPMDENGHGSHCAGIIGAVGNNRRGVAGVAWRAKIMGLKFLNADGNGCVSDAITCLSYAAQKGVKIINCSFGSTEWDDYFYIQVQIMAQRGVIFVCAAGNATNGMPARDNDEYPFYPCNYPCSNIVSVAATDADDNLASFSYFGAQNVDIAAPGVDIESSVLGSMAYEYKSGTSMATPHVVGALALLMAEYPDESPYDIVERLYAAGEEVASLNGKVRTGKRLSLENFFGLPAPSAVTASQGTIQDAVGLYWTAVENASHYRVWRADAEDGTKTALCEWTRGLTFSDETALPGSNYWYFVQAAASAEGADASAYSEGVPGFRPEIPENRVTVTFNANGGLVGEAKRNYTAGDPYGEFPAATYADHVFLGWHTAATGGTRVDNVSIVRQDVTTLFAHWATSSELRVENLAAQQRYPWNGKVDVMFDLNGVPEKEYASLALTAKEEGEEQDFTLATYDGNAPTNLPAGNHRVIWNADADKPNALFENLTLSATASIDVPRAPASGTASNNVAAGGIDLAWTAAHGASSYEIWRSTSSALGSAAKLLDCAELTCLDGSCAMGTYYYYWIKSKSSGGTSPDALALEARRGLEAPKNVSAADGTSCEKVTVTWTASDGATGYDVYRSTGTSSGLATKIGSVTATTYADSAASAGQQYYYWVKATLPGYESEFSASDGGWKKLSAPSNVAASDDTASGGVAISWSPSAGATSYEIWRGTSNSSGNASKIGASATTGYTDASAAVDTQYYYWVKAVCALGVSDFSASVGGCFKKVLVSLEIEGSRLLKVGDVVTYTAKAIYNDGTSKTVTPTWKLIDLVVLPMHASISAAGVLTADKVAESSTFKVAASYSEDGVTVSGEVSVVIKAIEVTVTFNANGGTPSSQTQTYTAYGTYGSFPSVSQTDYTFVGWYTASSGGSQVTASSTVPAVNTTLYAHWAAIVIVPTAPTSVSATDGTYSEKVTVRWSAVSGATAYYVYRSTSNSIVSATQVGSTSSTSYDDTLAVTGTTYWYWVKAYRSDYSQYSAFSAGDSGYSAVTLQTALDNTDLTFMTGGDANWIGVKDVSYDGTDSARSGTISAGQSTWLQTTVTGPGTFTFRWKFPGESNSDKLVFTIDGTSQETISGTSMSSFEQKRFDIATGAHTLKWTYSKDPHSSGVSSCGWVDTVDYSAVVAAPSIVGITASSASSVTVSWVPQRGVTSYEIYRSISANSASATQIATVTDGTSFTDTSLHLVGTRYYYWVKAVTSTATTDFGAAFAYVCQPTYLVVDLSAGGIGTEYPIRTMWSAPSNGWDDGYKTTNLVLRLIQPGTFVMGCDEAEIGHENWGREAAVHNVTITKPYYIGVFEVTQKQFQLVSDSDSVLKWAFDPDEIGDLRPVERVSYSAIRGQNAGIQWPLSNCVDSTSFMGIIRSRTHLMFDLPTEAQWEYACRAGTTTALNNGKGLTGPDDDDSMAEVGRYRYNQGDGKGGYSSAHTCVGSYAPNNWGLYDMHGNVWEWCLDYYAYRNTDGFDTGDAVDPIGVFSGTDRVVRGGCCGSPAKECRSASRSAYDCLTVSSQSGSTKNYLGFRVCCPADETSTRVEVSFDANGGMGMMSAVEVEAGKSLTLPAVAFSRSGYYFDGWATSASGNVVYTDGATIPSVASDMTLYAKWIPQLTQKYVVIDLSEGPNATNYPVSELEDVPNGEWPDEYKTKKLVLRRIPNGSYMMGCETSEVGYTGREARPHQVIISKPFYIGVFEVTQKQYQLVMGDNPSKAKGDARPVANVSYDTIRGGLEGAKWPSENSVDAASFMGKIRDRTGLTFDLPTEAQWEYACRAGTTTALNSGKNLVSTGTDSNMDEVGRYVSNEGDDKGGYEYSYTTVGSFKANNWGLYDMHGNVEEWCLDWYVSRETDGFDSCAMIDPKGVVSGSSRILRGGYCGVYALHCRSASRSHYDPSDLGTSSCFSHGFRLCCAINQATVSFDANGGIGVMSSVTVDAGKSLTLPMMTDISRNGYTFAGWATDVVGGGVVYADGATVTNVVSDMTLYAKWVPQLKETYVVIDLSAGADATNYPVSELENIPSGGWTDEYKTTKLVLRRIPNGTFTMGSPSNEVGRYSYNHEEQHQVTISKPFYMGVFEVTQKQYKLVTGGNPSTENGDARPVECVSYLMIRGASLGMNWPLTNAVDTISFMSKIRSRTGLTFDLPTEAQWEYACRAGTTTALNNGCNLTNAYDDANMNLVGRYEYNSGRGDTPCDGKGNTTYAHAKVGAYLANNWGLYDMHGNVDEWCLDRYVSSLDTTAVVDPKGATSGASRVLRGGSWNSHALSCRSAYRNGSSPVYSASGRGFRLCCPAGEATDQVTVTFDANGGSGTMAAAETGKGGSFAIPKVAFVRTGYAFQGWATSMSGDVVYADGATIPCMSANMTLYAKWAYTPTQTYLVIDLSAGADANEYAISELSSVPSGGWTDEYKTTKLVLRRIANGSFTMGCETNEVGYSGNEARPHQVSLSKPYYMGVFQVTQKQYELVMGSNHYYAYKGDARPQDQVSYDVIRGSSEGMKWPSSNSVDATTFMGKIRARTGLTFDLPTEAQWEYACRAGTTTALNSGKNLTGTSRDANMAEVGRYAYNTDDGKGGYSTGDTTVGSYIANNWGLYDMHGNVSELCLDWYVSRGTRGFDSAAVTDPKGGESGSGRVRRGGRWDFIASWCRSAYRNSVSSSNLNGYTGFRLCCPAGDATDQVTVTFDANGGTGTMTAVSVGNGGSMVVPECAFSRSGHVFAGWATSSSGSEVYEAGATIPSVTSALTLYAKWSAPSKTYLVVDLSGGTSAANYPLSELDDVPSGGWTDEYKTNKLVLRRIANGSYTMGCETTEIGYVGSEAQPHLVTISKPFYMGVFEVTQRQYELVIGSNPAGYEGVARPVEHVSYDAIRGSSDGAKWPLEGTVDAMSFLGKVRLKTGLVFDLPTEAQWEYACRAGTTTALNSGKNLMSTNRDENMAEVGRYNYNQDDGNGGYSSEHTTVGSYLPNNWGLYDMHGNVWEWCLDRYVARGTAGFDSDEMTDPKGASSGSYRVLRGGNYDTNALGCRSAYRSYNDSACSHYNFSGFRLCCPAGEATDQVTVTFDPNGGSGTMAAVETGAGGSFVIPKVAFVRTGYAFQGWATNAVGDVVYADGATIPCMSENMTLYAKWTYAPTQTYLVIDLSAGAGATNYPVSYLDDVPPGGWTDEYKTTKLVLRLIANGSFTMGCETSEVGYYGHEAKPHQVTISKPFYMGVFEVTQKQYQLVMGSNPSSYMGDARPVEYISYDTIRGSSEGAKWPSSNSVDSVSFMGKIRSRTGLTFDLPTEAQWEYACRAGTATALNNGKNLTSRTSDANMAEVGRYYYNQSDGKGGYSSAHTTVGSYTANDWGLYDMHGNVWEWCLDWYVSRGTSGFDTAVMTDPKGAASGSYRVLRGGTWHTYAYLCRSANRINGCNPSDTYGDGGFRLCCPAGEATDQVTVTFDANGGSGTMAPVETGKGGSFAIPKVAFVRTGYAFRGWATSAFGDVVYADGATIPCMSENMTLYAKWTYAPTQTYLVIDLSAGTNANEYAISELSSVPSGGWTDEYKTTKLVLRRIANGSFTMGCETTETGYTGYEAKPHQVTISKPFYMGVFEVTQKQYELVMGSNPSWFNGDARPVEFVSYCTIRGSSEGAKWPSANSVDSTSFMGKIRARTGLTFDLPTEAQWEYACRAGTTTALNSGKNLTSTESDPNMDEAGRYGYNSGWNSTCDGKGNTACAHAEVGAYLPNNWGLYDMHGNVWEWCLDWYVSRGTSGFDSGAVTDPKGASSGSSRVRRGGDWRYDAYGCRSAFRLNYNPSDNDYYLGFRLSMTMPIATDQVTVTFDANGGSGTMAAVETGRGGSFVIPKVAFTRTGYTFQGWATSASGDVVYADGATIPCMSENMTLYAKWAYAPTQTYLVIDLSAGTNANEYAISELSNVPSGGWTDEYKTTKLVLRRIANGSFTMGSPADEVGRDNDEDRHQVTISKSFYMGIFEVTQKQYELVMGSNPSLYKGDARPVEYVSFNTIRGSSDGAKWPSTNAVDSTSFMGKIRARTGLTFDLPTEAQWEYACRAGTTTALNSGRNLTNKTSSDANMAEVGRYYYNSNHGTYDEKGQYSQHAVVGSYLPNNWGLYDMHGNVWEWCLDWYQSALGTSAVTDPKGASSGSCRAMRGGSWAVYAQYCRSAIRVNYDPSFAYGNDGFRLCCPAGL